MRKSVTYSSLIGNVCLIAIVIYIGCIKTSYINSKLESLGLMKVDPKDRQDYYCIKGWTNTLDKLNLDVDVVFFGASIICGSSFEKDFPNVSICNLGYPGDTTDGMLLRINQIKAVNPEKVFVLAGLNGIKYQSKKVFKEKYSIMVDSIKRMVPNAKVYLQSILPVNPSMKSGFSLISNKIPMANEIIKTISEEKGCIYIDLYKVYAVDGIMPAELTRDGVHLFPEAYNKWVNEIRKILANN